MALPVTTVSARGLPVVLAPNGLPVSEALAGTPVTIATNGFGLPVAFVGGVGPPVNTVAPVVTGTPTPSNMLSSTTGTWTGAAPITYTYQWYSSPTPSTADGVVIAGATSSTYTIPGTAIPAPALDLNFVADTSSIGGTPGSSTAPLTVTRASTGYADNAAGVWSSFAANTARRTDKGLLVEEARTNAIRNNSMQGTVAGDPGTVPTNWTISDAAAGLERTIVGTETQNGIDYIDVRFAGTVSGGTVSAIDFEPGVGGIAAAQNDVRTISAFVALVGGTITSTGIASIDLRHRTLTAAGAGLNNFIGPSIRDQLTSTMRRFSFTATYTDATTGLVIPRIGITPNVVSTVVDFTLRIGWPQLELGAFVTSPIRTTTAAATRAADFISGTFAGVFNDAAGTAVADFVLGGDLASARVWQISNNTNSDAHYGRLSSGGGWQNATFVASVAQAAPAGWTAVALERHRNAYAYAANDFAASNDGGAVVTDTVGTVPTGLNTLHFCAQTNAEQFGGYIRRFSYYPARLPNSNLQVLSGNPYYFCRVTATNGAGSANANSNVVPAGPAMNLAYLVNADPAYIVDKDNSYITAVAP